MQAESFYKSLFPVCLWFVQSTILHLVIPYQNTVNDCVFSCMLWKLFLFPSSHIKHVKKLPTNYKRHKSCRDLRILKIVVYRLLTYYKSKRLLNLFKLNLSLFKCVRKYNIYHLFTIGIFRFGIIFLCIQYGTSMIFWEKIVLCNRRIYISQKRH